MNKLIHSGITTYVPELKINAGLFKLFHEVGRYLYGLKFMLFFLSILRKIAVLENGERVILKSSCLIKKFLGCLRIKHHSGVLCKVTDLYSIQPAISLNLFHIVGLFLYHLKASKNLRAVE